MAINGLLTDVGLTNSQIALNNQGWFIFPTRFEVAETAGTFDKTRVGARDWIAATAYAIGDLVVPTTPNGFYYIVSVAGTSGGSEPTWPTSAGSVVDGGVTWDFVGATSGGLEAIWFAAAISTRIEGPPNTIEIVLTIPPGADPSDRDIDEVYVFAEDQLGVEFLVAVGQPDATITYDKEGTTSLRLAITLTNVNISGLFVFKYTQATEIAEHAVDPNAHPDIRDILQLQFNLADNGDMGVDRNPGGFSLGAKTFGFGPAGWEGQLTAVGAVSGSLIRKTTSILTGSRSMHFSGISLTGGGEELHIRKRIRSDTARLLSNDPWVASTDYVVGDIVVPTASPLLRFRATVAGTASSTEPAWPSLAGDTIVDGGVTWEAILGNFSMSWEVFQDTGSTQFAIITIRTPDALDDFGGSQTTLLTSGATDHPMLDGVVSTPERAAIVLPNVDNGLEIDIQVDTGVLSSKNFEFSRFKYEPTEKVSPYLSPPHVWEKISSSGYLEDYLDFQIIIGTQAQVDKGFATHTVNNFAVDVGNGDRILILEGTHTLTGSIVLTENNLQFFTVGPDAVMDLASTYDFTLSGDNCTLNIPIINMTADSLVLGGNGSRYIGFDELLVNINITGNSWAITGDGIKTLLGVITSGGDATFADLTVTKKLIGLAGISYDMIVGSPTQVSNGKATHGATDWIDAVTSGMRIKFIANIALNKNAAFVSKTDIEMDFGAAAQLSAGAFNFSLDAGSHRWTINNLWLSGFGVGDFVINSQGCKIHVIQGGAASIYSFGGSSAGSIVFDESSAGGIFSENWSIAADGTIITGGNYTGAGAVASTNPTNSSSGGTGSINTVGGLGVSKDLFVGGKLLGLNGISYDIIVGSAGQVSSGKATHTVADFVAAIAINYRILILNGNHKQVRNEDITESGVHIEFEPGAILDGDGGGVGPFSLTISGGQFICATGRFTGYAAAGIILSAQECLVDAVQGDWTWFNITGTHPFVRLSSNTGAMFSKDWSIRAGGIMRNEHTGDATSGASGSFSTAGGLGVTKSLFVGNQLRGLAGISFDKIVGTTADVSAGIATHALTLDAEQTAFFAALADNDRIYVLPGTHVLTANRDFDHVRLKIYFDPEANIDDGANFTITFSGESIRVSDGRFQGFNNADFIVSGAKCYISASIDSAAISVTNSTSIVESQGGPGIGGFFSQYWSINSDGVLVTRQIYQKQFTITTEGSPYTFGTNDESVLLVNETEDMTINLPAASGNSGLTVHIKNIMASNTVTIDGNASETIDGVTTLVLGSQYQSVTLICDGSNWHVL